MRLMRLAPESVRLRRIAKAWAAGECSQEAYREARREVIDNFSPRASGDDDTRPRWDDQTLRSVLERTGRGGSSRAACWPSGSGSAVHGELDTGTGAGETPSRAASRWLLLLAAILALFGVLSLWPALVSAAPSVPPVSQRDPNPASSPRLPVREVQLGADTLAPFAGVDAAAVEGVVQRALAAIQERNAVREDGFTAVELEEVGRYLSVLGVHQEGDLNAADARDLSALIRDQKRRRGISVLELEEIAQAAQNYLRGAGYFLAVVYVPSQEVTDGAVRLEALPGRLGDIVVDGGDSEPVVRHFADLLGQPLTLPVVSARLHELNTVPGFQAQASLEPAETQGDTRLRLSVVEQRNWIGQVRVDNHGDSATGDQRLSVNGSWLNPRGVGDRLDAGLLAAVNPENQTYGFVAYEAPLGAFHLRGQVGSNDFTWDREVSLDGEGTYLDLSARRSLTVGDGSDLSLLLGAARHELDWAGGLDQSVSEISAGLSGSRVWRSARVAADGLIRLTAGHIGKDLFAGQEADFWALEADLLAWTPLNLPLLDGEQKFSVRVQGQLADSHLPATQRFALSGPYRSRAFDRGDLMTDQGVVLSLDLRTPIRVGELALFLDTAYGESRNELTPAWRHATDLGLAWDADLGRRLTSRLSWAAPLTTKGTGGIDDDGARFFWSLEYAH